MTDAPGMIEGMGKNTYTPQSIKSINSEGGGFEIAGAVITVLTLAIGLVVLFSSGGTTILLLSPIGLLLMVVGYLKKISAAVTATYTLASNQAVTSSEELDAPQA